MGFLTRKIQIGNWFWRAKFKFSIFLARNIQNHNFFGAKKSLTFRHVKVKFENILARKIHFFLFFCGVNHNHHVFSASKSKSIFFYA